MKNVWCLLVCAKGKLGFQSICTDRQFLSPRPSPQTEGLNMKFMVWVMCAMSSHFTRQIRWVAIRAAVNDVLQGSTWSFTAFHKSEPTSFRREPLKRNHGNYMFAQGKWNRTFPSVFSSLPSFYFFFSSLDFVALTNYDTPHSVAIQQSWKDILSCSSWLGVYLWSCIYWHVVPWKKSARLRLERQI